MKRFRKDMPRSVSRELPLFLGAVLLAGCSLFDTRDPSDPIGELPRRMPNHPDSVVWNLETGIRFKQGGSPQISEALASNMVFVLDETDAQTLNGIDSLQKGQVEVGIDGFFSIQAGTDSVVIDIKLEERTREEQGDSETIYFGVPYELLVFRNTSMRPENRQVRIRAGGIIDLTFRELSNGNYEISRWVDKLSPPVLSTFGYYIGFYSGAG